MLPELGEEVGLELTLLRQLLDDLKPVTGRAAEVPPSKTDVLAAAALLHAFYTGIENIFKRVAVHCGEELPRSGAWHTELLDAMTRTTDRRPAVVSQGLRMALKSYLDFRHYFRHSYSFHLDWDRMSPLATGAPSTLARLEAELQRFLGGRR